VELGMCYNVSSLFRYIIISCIHENYDIVGYCVVRSGKFLLTFWDKFLLEVGTDILARNVGNSLHTITQQTAAIHSTNLISHRTFFTAPFKITVFTGIR
jgi:hypothetical protein